MPSAPPPRRFALAALLALLSAAGPAAALAPADDAAVAVIEGARTSLERPRGPSLALRSLLPPVVQYRGEQILFDLQLVPAAISPLTSCKLTVTYPTAGGGVALAAAWSDEEGRVTVAVDARGLGPFETLTAAIWCEGVDEVIPIPVERRPGVGPCVPDRVATDLQISNCSACPDCGPGFEGLYLPTNEPQQSGVYLHDGTIRRGFPVVSYDGRFLDVDFRLFKSTQVICDGPLGKGWRSTYDDAIVQTSSKEAFYVTPDLQAFPFGLERDGAGPPGEPAGASRAAGPRVGDPAGPAGAPPGDLLGAPPAGSRSWSSPEGFFARFAQDLRHNHWTVTHMSGVRHVFAAGALGLPGPLIEIREPNGNRVKVERDFSGAISAVVSDQGQRLSVIYGDDGRIDRVADHLDPPREWIFDHDEAGNLVAATTPATEFADVGPGVEITDADLAASSSGAAGASVAAAGKALVTRGRTTTFSYGDPLLPHHLTRITDERGAVPVEYAYYHEPPYTGQVRVQRINGREVTYLYDPPASAVPAPLPLLDPGNRIVRVIDREGNVTDHELHGAAGGPIAGLGQFGLRREVRWTARGKGEAPLRQDEPLYWERRWLHDCDCLAPRSVSQPFRSDAPLRFGALGMPAGWPTESFEYNDRRQVTADEYRGFGETIRWEKTYGAFEEFSRELTYVEPRGFDDSPVYSALGPDDFTHAYAYDGAGNRVRHQAPRATRGVTDPGGQEIVERWAYNEHGQVLSHTDPNRNLTTYTYFEGPSTGGDVNAKGEFGGYLVSTTRGAAGSADAAPALTTRFRVNALGMVTRRIDAKGFVYDVEYNDLGETVRELDAEVTLGGGQKVRYETRHVYDGAGNRVLTRRSNVDLDATVAANAFIDRSQSFDAVNNLLSTRVEVDGNDGNDLVTRYRYDRNDQLAVVAQPEGNRTFHLYDERRLRFKTFYGVAPAGGADPAEAYPDDKRAEDLGGTGFVGFTTTTYDARINVTRTRDGRENLIDHFYDFYNRRVATSDQNGNGMVYVYDDASNVLTQAGGAVSKSTGKLTELLERTYHRYDELGRRYQSVMDIDPGSDESAAIDPDDGLNSSFVTRFDPGSRVVTRLDANGNPTNTAYDAADRTLAVTDALGNVRSYTYDDNSNVVRVEERERPGPGAAGVSELYVTTYGYDELNRRTESHVLGLNGNSIDHETFYAYDSRNNTRLVEDAEGNFTLSTFDDLDRVILTQRFNGDPFGPGAPTELIHYEYRYDRNSRKTHDIALSDVADPLSAQATVYLYDDLDRLVTTVYPDADDYRQAADGPGHLVIDPGNPNGADGTYDRVEVAYDENSNVVFTREQRGVEFANVYDAGNRLARQDVALPPSVPGTTRQEYDYDALNRLTEARNDYARVGRGYDPLSRLVFERQEIRLDGSGFTAGWERPVDLVFGYDRQSNRTEVRVVDPTGPAPQQDLLTLHAFDALNRMSGIDAEYFDRPLHRIAGYAFHGPWRVQTKTYGNGARLTNVYDVKRRIAEHAWRDGTPEQNLLVGFQYDYDDVDNPLYERFLHDEGLYDNYAYNDRYELTAVSYREAQPRDYRTDPGPYRDTFVYDDNFNRRQASFGDPFGAEPPTEDAYAINKANEYTAIDRQIGGQPAGTSPPLHDAAGNMTRFPTRPAAGGNAGRDVDLHATWDAFNMLFTATVPDPDREGGEFLEHYRYDPFRRRIAKFDLSQAEGAAQPTLTLRRYIWDGWSCTEERTSEERGVTDIPTTLTDRLERIYVNGQVIDEPLLAAIDGDADRDLDGGPEPINTPDGTDFEYHYLTNRLGSTIGLAVPGNLIASYRYTVYGTPLRSDIMNISSLGGRNSILFTGRRFDQETGLAYYRFRYMNDEHGRFLQADPMTKPPGNLFTFVENTPTKFLDPLGLQIADDLIVGEPIDITAAEFRSRARLQGKDLEATYGYFTWVMNVKLCCACCNETEPKKFELTVRTLTASGEIHLVPGESPILKLKGAPRHADLLAHEKQHQKNAERFFDEEKGRVFGSALTRPCEARWQCISAAIEIIEESMGRKVMWHVIEKSHVRGFDKTTPQAIPPRSTAIEMLKNMKKSMRLEGDCVSAEY